MMRRLLTAGQLVLFIALFRAPVSAQTPPAPAPAKKWDVTEALGPTSRLQLETSEGTRRTPFHGRHARALILLTVLLLRYQPCVAHCSLRSS